MSIIRIFDSVVVIALYGSHRAEEGLPSSEHNFPYMPIPIHRRVLPRCISRVFARSLAFAAIHGARLSLVPCGSDFTSRRIHFTLRPASLLRPNRLSTDAPSLGSRHQTSASYEAVWPLPRSDSRRLVVPILAGRAEYSCSLTGVFN